MAETCPSVWGCCRWAGGTRWASSAPSKPCGSGSLASHVLRCLSETSRGLAQCTRLHGATIMPLLMLVLLKAGQAEHLGTAKPLVSSSLTTSVTGRCQPLPSLFEAGPVDKVALGHAASVCSGCCSEWVQAGGEPPAEGHEVGLHSFNFTNV